MIDMTDRGVWTGSLASLCCWQQGVDYRLPLGVSPPVEVRFVIQEQPRQPIVEKALWVPIAAALAFFAALYAKPAYLLVRDWTNFDNPDSGTGLLLAPLAFYFAYQTGLKEQRKPAIALGIAFLLAAIGLRFVSDLAAELFTMRVSMLIGAAGVILWFFGVKQLLAWWLPFVLLGLAIPLPELVISKLTAPLQLVASRIGAALIEARHIPVLLNGNVIRIPGHDPDQRLPYFPDRVPGVFRQSGSGFRLHAYDGRVADVRDRVRITRRRGVGAALHRRQDGAPFGADTGARAWLT